METRPNQPPKWLIIHEIEARIQQAIAVLRSQKKVNISKTAREFDVPRKRLEARWKGRGTYAERPLTNMRLSPAQDLALCQYINTLDQLGAPPRLRMIENCANSILKSNHDNASTSPPKIGKDWLHRWLDRHPQYKRLHTKAIDLDRKKSHDQEAIQDWFKRLERMKQNHGIVDEDIWNFDKTGFQIGIGKDQWIVTRDFKKKSYLGCNTNREYVTVVEAICADGSRCSPLIILPGKCIIKGWFDHAEADCHIGVSESGYMTDSLAFQWIQMFHVATMKSKRGQYRLLICDGFGSHMTYEFIQFCERYDIVVFFLPPHTSHFLQPLDVGVFHAYKHWHSEAIADATYTGCGKFTKIEFLAALTEIRHKTFKKRTIWHGFCDTGLVPHNPAIVLENLPEVRATTPVSESSISSNLTIHSTPKTAQKFKSFSLNMRRFEPESSNFHDQLNKLIKGSIAQAHLAESLRDRLDEFISAQHARQERSRASRRRIQVGGMVSSHNLARITRLEKEYDEIKERNQLRAKWKRVMAELIDYALDRGIIVRRSRKSRNTV